MTAPGVHPVAGALGAEISGVDLSRELDDGTVAAIRRAWLEPLVLFFRAAGGAGPVLVVGGEVLRRLGKGLVGIGHHVDVVLGNLESVISTRYSVPWLLPDYFTYNSPPELVTSFRRPNGRSTFAALATCNNHALDRGDQGMLDTLAFLDARGIRHAGRSFGNSSISSHRRPPYRAEAAF